MEYLARKKFTAKARCHVWTGFDTACRMASSGGLRLSKYMLIQGTGGRLICKNCLNVIANRDTKLTAIRPELLQRIPREKPIIDEVGELDLVFNSPI